MEDIAFAAQRHDMVNEVAAVARETGTDFADAHPISGRVLDAMMRVPRHVFIPAIERDLAYENRPLPIGFGQTISQPYIVAFMTDLLMLAPGDRVLEVGTGCGYQTAVLAELGCEVYSVEIVEPLAAQAARTLSELGYAKTVHTRCGDGYQGWVEYAPYDAIIVTAGCNHVPSPLLAQLKPGGRMVLPIGEAYAGQELRLIETDADGRAHQHDVLPVRFVPLTGGH